jgi:hypothetical protein
MGNSYNEALAKVRRAAQRVAQKEIPKLYKILTTEEKKTPDDARAIIERDLIDIWSAATILKYLPAAVKNQQKVRAGKIGRQKQIESAGERRAEITVDNNGSQFLTSGEDKAEELRKLLENDNKAEELRKLLENDNKAEELRKLLEKPNAITDLPEKRGDRIGNVEALCGSEPAEISKLREKLESAEMEVRFFKDELGDGNIISLKGRKEDGVGQFYWGRIGIEVLKQKLPQLQNSGVRAVEVYMEAIT